MIPPIDHLQQLTSKPEHNGPWNAKLIPIFQKKTNLHNFVLVVSPKIKSETTGHQLSVVPLCFSLFSDDHHPQSCHRLTHLEASLKLGFHTSKPWRMVPKPVNFQHGRNWCIKCIICICILCMCIYISYIYIHVWVYAMSTYLQYMN